ncbi:CLUMA_CG001982, isoform A [Clunio marinus]|uniref:Short-chain dehydrogenase/reductase 3 n=1 Tax=Clunio marinus TaxID=568069 RepID=A0A1J1HPR2_9DIPT|nr:CLUMA_CG001982, isoform A [Clunio marinus]
MSFKFYFLVFWDCLKTFFVSCGLICLESKKLFFYKRKDVRGKLALITGGGHGLGRGISLRLAELGCRIVIADVNLEAAEKTCKEIRDKGVQAKAYKVNVTKANEIEKLRDNVFNDLGAVDILINNAGLMSNSNLDETPENIETMLKVNVLGPILVTKCFLDQMKERRNGHIVCIASMSGIISTPHNIPYTASKFGAYGFMSALEENLRIKQWRKYIKTTTICPYFIKTREDIVDFLNSEIRFPALETKEAAYETVEAILREDRVVAIPGYQKPLCKFLNLFPLSVQEAARDRILREFDFTNPNFLKGMAWYEIPNTTTFSIYFTLAFGVVTIIFVFCLWVKATCGMFTSSVRMDGKTVLITGANSGIGKETARDLAKRGARIIMACRTMDTAYEARDEIIKQTGNENILIKKLDLSSQKSVRDFAAEIMKTEKRIDVLIHNAGYANTFHKAKSVDGIELSMATNHYGPFLLTHLLIDLLKKSAPCRIVVVASGWYRLARLNLKKHLNQLDGLPGYLYYVSKSANIMFAMELAKRLQGTGITVNSLHPGVIDSGIWRNVPFPLSIGLAILNYCLFKTVVEGAQTTIMLACSEELNDVTGKYFSDCKESELQPYVTNSEDHKRLWDESIKMIKLTDTDPKI